MIGLMSELDEFGLLMRNFKIKSSFDLTKQILRWNPITDLIFFRDVLFSWPTNATKGSMEIKFGKDSSEKKTLGNNDKKPPKMQSFLCP